MNIRRVIAALLSCALLTTLPFALAGCSGVSPEEAIADTTDTMADVESMAFSSEMQVETNGAVSPVSLDGVMRYPGDSRMTIKTEVLGQSVALEQIVVDGVAYVKYPQLDQWGYMSLGINISSPGQSAAPTSYLTYLESLAEVTDMGTDEVDGVECYHYGVDVDETALVDVMMEQAAAQGVEFDDPQIEEAIRELYEGSEIYIEIWIGIDDMLPRREDIDMSLEGDVPTNVAGTIFFFDFDEPVDITAPTDAVPLEELAAQAGAAQ